jgi:hypothetical protein
MRLVNARRPSGAEWPILAESLSAFRGRFAADPAAARRLIRVGESPCNGTLDPAEVAAYTALCSLLLNLDETINKE